MFKKKTVDVVYKISNRVIDRKAEHVCPSCGSNQVYEYYIRSDNAGTSYYQANDVEYTLGDETYPPTIDVLSCKECGTLWDKGAGNNNYFSAHTLLENIGYRLVINEVDELEYDNGDSSIRFVIEDEVEQFRHTYHHLDNSVEYIGLEKHTAIQQLGFELGWWNLA